MCQTKFVLPDFGIPDYSHKVEVFHLFTAIECTGTIYNHFSH